LELAGQVTTGISAVDRIKVARLLRSAVCNAGEGRKKTKRQYSKYDKNSNEQDMQIAGDVHDRTL
jgi:hypothetical protein